MATPSHDGHPGYFYVGFAFIFRLRLSPSPSCFSFELGTCLRFSPHLILDSQRSRISQANSSRMAHFLLYSSELAQMGTDQQEHEQQHPSVQTRSQSSDTRAFLQMNGPQSYPCSQYENENWPPFGQPPGSAMPFSHPDYNPHLSGSGLETYDSTRLQVSRPPIGHCCVSSFSSGSPSKVSTIAMPIFTK